MSKKINFRDFKGIWIPKEIWEGGILLWIEIMLWAEIDSLYKEEMNGCYASNSYFAKFFKVSEKHISNSISSLKKLGLVKQISFNGRKRILKAIPPSDAAQFQAALTSRLRQTLPTVPCSNNLEVKAIYNNKEDNKEDTLLQQAEECETQTEINKKEIQDKGISGNKEKQHFSMAPVLDTNKRNTPAPKTLDSAYEGVLKVYRDNIFKNCSDRTKTIIAGIPRAVKMINDLVPDNDPIEFLVKAILEFRKSDKYTWQVDNKTLGLAPKYFFSESFVQNTLIPILTIKHKKYGFIHTEDISDERLRADEEANERSRAEFMERRRKQNKK